MAEQIKFGDRLFLSGERVITEVDVQINRDLKVNRDVIIQGNLDVNGTVTTIDTTDLFIADPIVGMNYDHTGVPTEDVGFEIFRGDEDNVFFVWDETLDSWSTRGTDLIVKDFTATGDALINGTLHVDGQSTLASVNVEDLTNDRIVIVGTNGELEDDVNFTFDGIDFNVGLGNFTVNRPTGDTYIAGQLTAESANIKDLTNNRITIAGIDGELEDDANFTMDGVTFDIGQGNFTVDVATGDFYSAGQTSLASLNVLDLTNNRIVIVGINGELEDDANFTFDGSSFNIGQGNFTVSRTTGNTQIVGTLDVDSQGTFASANVEDLTNNRIVIVGTNGELEDDINLTFDGTTLNVGQGNFVVETATGITTIQDYTSIVSSNALRIPVGTSLQRPGETGVPINAEQGQIRYNTVAETFEGYDGSTWGSLSATQDADKNTYIIPETSPGVDNNQLDFYTAAVHRMRLDNNGDMLFGYGLNQLTVDYSTGDTNIAGDVNISGSTIISGDLTVTGTTTTINTEEILLADNIITLNSNYAGSSPTENAGIEVNRGSLPNSQVKWNETTDIWEFTNDGNVYRPIPHTTDDLNEGISNLYFTTARARQSIDIGANSDELRYDDTTGLLTYHGSAVILSDNAPTSNLRDGFIWYDTLTTGRSYVYSETIGSWIDLSPGIVGDDGKSAYQVAIEQGFVGTVTAWLETLIGPVGPQGPFGPPMNLQMVTDMGSITTTSMSIGGNLDIGNTNVTSESHFQGQSPKAGESFLAVDWTYTNFIEAIGEMGSTSTGIGLGATTGFTDVAQDNISFVTLGEVQAIVDENGRLGIGTVNPEKKLHVVGEIAATGDITAFYSDERLKDFDGKIDGALDKLDKINGYYYKGNDVAAEFGYNTDERQVGVSAQEVEAILPEVVKTAPISLDGETDYKTVQYEKLVPLLIEAIKELKDEVEKLKGN